jgi:hypothetical protein
LHFEPLQWVGNRLDIQGIRVLLLAGRKKTFSSLKHLCWPWDQGPTHHSVLTRDPPIILSRRYQSVKLTAHLHLVKV